MRNARPQWVAPALVALAVAVGSDQGVPFTWAQDSVAQDASDDALERERRYAKFDGDRLPVLNDHVFIPNSFVRGPFIRTQARMLTGYGRASGVPTPQLIVAQDTLVIAQADLIFLTLEFEYQHRVKDWAGVWLKVSGLGRVGTNVETLLAQGVQAASGFELGWIFRLYEAQKSALSLSTALSNTDVTGVNLIEWVDRIIIDGGLSPDNELVRRGQSIRSGAGLRWAWAPHEMIGLKTVGEIGIGEDFNSQEGDEIFYRVGAAGELNLYPRTAVPLGIALGGIVSRTPELGTSNERSTFAGMFQIAYTEQNDFSISLETSFQELPLDQFDQTLDLATASFTIRYYF